MSEEIVLNHYLNRFSTSAITTKKINYQINMEF
ncbi:hypothetical protein CLU83_1953 [Flavobacterium sp. 1]|nr:hypothetical protein CLU83_1953 [Flavobacterium sp. 1]